MLKFDDILRRRTPQILGIYLGAGWALLEFSEWIVGRYGLSPSLTDVILIALVSMIPTVLILAYFHGTPGPNKWTRIEKIVIPANVGLAILLMVVIPRDKGSGTLPDTTADAGRVMLAVLPFENLGSPEDIYFADGITEEITARLAGVRGLGVIARTSASRYRNTEKSLQEIGQELGVSHLLEGSVRWQRLSDGTSRVRVTPRLSRVADAIQLWASIYDNRLSEVFEVQSDIASQVVDSLGVALLEPERETIAAKPTDNLESYDYYLRGNFYHHRSFRETDLNIAIDMYEKATASDPGFAKAYAKLAEAHAQAYWYRYDRSVARLSRAKKAVDQAFALAPNLAEAHVALGYYYYWGYLDYDKALEHFESARENKPNSGDLLTGIGFVQRRQGHFEQAAVNFEMAFKLDPLAAMYAFYLGETYELLRNYSAASRYYDLAIALKPDVASFYVNKSQLLLRRHGAIDSSRALLETAKEFGFGQEAGVILASIQVDKSSGDFRQALRRLKGLRSEAIDWQWYYRPRTQLYAELYDLMGDKEQARVYYDSARITLERSVQEDPGDARLHSALGIIYAGLGQKNLAIQQGKLGVELLPITKEAWNGLYRIEDLARIYVMTGEYEQALDQLEFLLSRPGLISPATLRLDPVWRSLRDRPGYAGLVQPQI